MMGGGEGTAIPDDGAGGGRGGVGQVVHGHDVCSRAAAVRATTGYQFFQTQMVIQRVHLGLSAATDSRGTSTVSLSFFLIHDIVVLNTQITHCTTHCL